MCTQAKGCECGESVGSIPTHPHSLSPRLSFSLCPLSLSIPLLHLSLTFSAGFILLFLAQTACPFNPSLCIPSCLCVQHWGVSTHTHTHTHTQNNTTHTHTNET